jgi:hypothetical protein
MLSVIYKKRALPLCWLVAEGNKGHFSEESHITLVEQVKEIIPEGTEVMFLGDGEFDGIQLQTKIESYNWKYVCRTAKDTIITQADKVMTFEQLQISPGSLITLTSVAITKQEYGPVMAIAWWDEQYEEPIYLISNRSINDAPCEWYKMRFSSARTSITNLWLTDSMLTDNT